MAVSRVKTWIAELLTAADLNAEFDNILNNASSLAWPATASKDLDGNELILDGDGDTSITASVDDRIDFRIGGTDSVFFGHATGNTGGFVTIDPLAFTATASTNVGRLRIDNTNALTVPAGTTAIAAALYVDEANFTATGTITTACTVYIEAAPTEGGTNNYALYVDAGTVRFDGDLTLGTDLAVAEGGTGVSTLTDGGVLLGSGTSAITAMAVLADGEFIVGNGTTDPVAESGATVRTSLGLGTAAVLNLAQAAQTALEAETDEDTYVPPDLIKNSPGVAKAWASVDRSAGTPSLNSPSYNISSVTDNGAGETIVNLATDMSSGVYAFGANPDAGTTNKGAFAHTPVAGSFRVVTERPDDALVVDTWDFTCWAFGDQ